MRVMVVDDSRAVRARLVALLDEEWDVEVVGAAEDGAEAIALAQLHAPDAVVLDLNLPGMSGLEVLARLKAQPCPPVVIVLTNHAHPGYRDECIRGGADFFFDKSRDFDRVATAVASVVTSGRGRLTPGS